MKTLQQAAKECAHEHIEQRCKSTNCKQTDCRPFDRNVAGYHTKCRARYQEYRDGFLAGAAFVSSWISVEDRNNLMPNNQPLLLKDENGRVWTESEFMQERPFVIITHWRLIEYKE